MTKQETVKIMAMLGAFYAGGKNDPQEQAVAWHMILEKYSYQSAQKAILRYAENDTREYATFPAVGNIVAAIRKVEQEQEKPILDVLQGIQTGKTYHELSADAQRLISEQEFREWSRVDAEQFARDIRQYASILRQRTDYGTGDDAFNVTGRAMAQIEQARG